MSDAIAFSNIHVETKNKTTVISADLERLSGQTVESEPVESLIKYIISVQSFGITVPIDLRLPRN